MNVVRNNIIQIDQAGAPHFTVVQQPVQLEEVGGRHELQDVGGLDAELLGGSFVEVLHHLSYERPLCWYRDLLVCCPPCQISHSEYH